MQEDFEFKWFTNRSNWQQKAATEDENKAQEARSRKYGISANAKGNITKPGEYANVPDEKFGDPVNYKYPLVPQSRAINAVQYFNHPGQMSAGGYGSEDWAKIGKRIAEANGGSDKGYSYEKGKIITPSTAPKEE